MQGRAGRQGARRQARHRIGPLAFVLALPALVSPALAQEAPNPLLTFGYSASIRASDNYGLDPVSAGNSTFLDQGFSLGYRSETETQSIGFSASTVLRFADLPDRDYDPDFDNLNLRLDYALTGSDSRIGFQTSYNRVDIAFADPLYDLDDTVDPITGQDLRTGEGRRESWGLSASIDTGLSSPLGFNLGLASRGRSYSGTTDQSLYGFRTDSIRAGVRMNVSPVTALNFGGSYSLYDADDRVETERRTSSVYTGINHAFSPVLNLNASLGFRQIETDRTVGDLHGTTTQDGMTVSLELGRALTDGRVGLSYNRDISTDGTRDTLRVSRSLDLAEGELDMSLGITKGDGDPGAVGSLIYERPVWNGGISARVSHMIGSNFDGEEETRTSATLGWNTDLTPLTRAGLRISYLDLSNDTDGDLRRLSVSASLAYELTRDWAVAGGYEYVEQRDEPEDTARENSVFLRLQRQFQFRP